MGRLFPVEETHSVPALAGCAEISVRTLALDHHLRWAEPGFDGCPVHRINTAILWTFSRVKGNPAKNKDRPFVNRGRSMWCHPPSRSQTKLDNGQFLEMLLGCSKLHWKHIYVGVVRWDSINIWTICRLLVNCSYIYICIYISFLHLFF